MKTALALGLAIFLQQPTARANEQSQLQLDEILQNASSTCLSEEFSACVESGLFEVECDGKQGCVVRKCRQWAKDTCTTI